MDAADALLYFSLKSSQTFLEVSTVAGIPTMISSWHFILMYLIVDPSSLTQLAIYLPLVTDPRVVAVGWEEDEPKGWGEVAGVEIVSLIGASLV